MRLVIALLACLAGSAAPAADGSLHRAGAFDYYILALGWQPTWCATKGAGETQCGTPRGWTLHGLWPQHEEGWPSDCPAVTRNPSRAETAAMTDIMGSAGLAWYQWKKHGRCSGLDPTDYFAAARRAFGAAAKPAALAALDAPALLPASVVEAAFLRANPDWSVDTVTVTCRDGRIAEVRICLDKALRPRACAPDAVRDCTLQRALLDPVR